MEGGRPSKRPHHPNSGAAIKPRTYKNAYDIPISGPGSKYVPGDDRYLSTSSIYKYMRKVIPQEIRISADAKDIIKESASEYISFITHEAYNLYQRDKRHVTLTKNDVCRTIKNVSINSYMGPLAIHLYHYRMMEGYRRCSIPGDPFAIRCSATRRQLPQMLPEPIEVLPTFVALHGGERGYYMHPQI